MELEIAMKTFDVEVTREGKWWMFAIPELNALGQAKRLKDIESEAISLAAAWESIDENDVAVNINIPELDDVRNAWLEVDIEEQAAKAKLSEAAKKRKAIIKKIRELGWTTPDAGIALGVSRQRIHQLSI